MNEGFDFNERLYELECRPTEWLLARRKDLVREERRIYVERLAVTRVLDRRGALDDAIEAHDGVSSRTVREDVENARALEELPDLAAVAHKGDVSREQLTPTAQVADLSTDREWARRAPHCAPADLQRIERNQRTVTTADANARREARDVRMWWRRDVGMLSFRGELPDLDGTLVESVFHRMIERMHPAKGEAWDSHGHRGADALVELCRNYADVEAGSGKAKPHVVVHVDADGNGDVEGIPLAHSTIERMLGGAIIDPVLVRDAQPVAYGPGRVTIPARIERAIRARDLHCRWPGCERTHTELHHLEPISEGGLTEPGNHCLACVGGPDHHHKLAPQGPYRLVGNPNRPDGLHLVHHDDLAGARAGPGP